MNSRLSATLHSSSLCICKVFECFPAENSTHQKRHSRLPRVTLEAMYLAVSTERVLFESCLCKSISPLTTLVACTLIDLIRERVIVRLCHSLPDGKLQKEGRALCFTAGLLRTMAKGEEYSKDSHDAEAILAHYRIDKPFKRFY